MRTVDAAGLAIGDDHPTRIMGVLNVSKESPYDPSVFDDPGEAAAYVDDELIGEGADIVDVGLESANRRFEVLSADEELARLETAVETIESVGGDAVFSIETRYHQVAEAAIEAGFDMVNDIAGFADPEMPAVCREYDVAVGKMASPSDITRPGAVEETDWAERKSAAWASEADYVDQVYEALKQHGLTDKTIVDPAFGGWSEAQTLAQDREAFRRLREFRALGHPVLVSINRKNFLRDLADRSTEAALPVSLAATAMAVDRGTHVVRTHDVAETLDATTVGDAFARGLLTAPDHDIDEIDVTNLAELDRHAEAVGGERPAVTRAFRLGGLDADARETLTRVADGAGLTVLGESEAVVVGAPGAFERAASATTHDALAGALTEIANRVQ